MKLERKIEILKGRTSDNRYFFTQVWRDGANLISTNGWQVLAFHLSEAELAAPEIAKLRTLDEAAESEAKIAKKAVRAKTPEKIRKWLDRDAETVIVDAIKLRRFLRAYDYLRCPCCDGEGIRPAVNRDDPFEESRSVKIVGVLINANLLVEALAYLPGGDELSLSAWIEKRMGGDLDGRILRIKGEGWTLIQMHILDSEESKAEVFEAAEVPA